MFSGIIEATAQVLKYEVRPHAVTVWVARPMDFQDLKIGDSISSNGVCLTIESFDQQAMQFTLAAETLQVLKISTENLTGQIWNLERSLRFGDRIHGHLVTGHVEALGEVVKSEALGESWILQVQVPKNVSRYIWEKGSIAFHGVSLTVNRFQDSIVEVCLIPETTKRTNLGQLRAGQLIHIETDYLAKAYFQGKDHGLSPA